MLFADNMYEWIYTHICPAIAPCWPTPWPCLALSPLPYMYQPFPFIDLEVLFLVLVVWISIHPRPWLASTVLPLLLNPPRRHPTDQITYLHRRHQQHQPVCLIQYPLIWCQQKLALALYTWRCLGRLLCLFMMAAWESDIYYPHHEVANRSPMCVHDVAGKSAIYYTHHEGVSSLLSASMKQNLEFRMCLVFNYPHSWWKLQILK